MLKAAKRREMRTRTTFALRLEGWLKRYESIIKGFTIVLTVVSISLPIWLQYYRGREQQRAAQRTVVEFATMAEEQLKQIEYTCEKASISKTVAPVIAASEERHFRSLQSKRSTWAAIELRTLVEASNVVNTSLLPTDHAVAFAQLRGGMESAAQHAEQFAKDAADAKVSVIASGDAAHSELYSRYCYGVTPLGHSMRAVRAAAKKLAQAQLAAEKQSF